MKTSLCFPNRTFRRASLLAFLALFPATTFRSWALATSGDVIAPLGAPDTSSGNIMSPGVHEVLQMVQAKVAPDVVHAYIKNSTTTYNLTASQIIALKDQGVPDDLLAAMLQRNGELNAQTRQSVQPYPNAAAQPAYPPAQSTYPPAVAPYPAQPNYAPDYTTVPYTDYGYGYPYYYPYSAYYPYSYYSYPYFGFSAYYPYCYGYYGRNCYYYRGHWYPYWGHGGHVDPRGGFHVHAGTFAHSGFVSANHAFAPAHNFAGRTVAPHSGFAPSRGFGGHPAGFAMSGGGFRTGGTAGFRGGGGARGGGGFAGGRGGGGHR